MEPPSFAPDDAITHPPRTDRRHPHPTQQRRANQAPPNLDWLESTANACELRPTLGGQGESGRAGQGGQGVTLLPAGPEASDPRKYFTAALGMGHISTWGVFRSRGEGRDGGIEGWRDGCAQHVLPFLSPLR